MLSSSLIVLGLATVVQASPYKRFDGVVVELTAPSGSVDSIADLKLTATVKNTGSETLKILNYGTILDSKLPTKSFTVVKDGNSVPFTGIKLSVSLNDVDDTAFTIIPVGESVTVTHEVAPLYDFASAGTGTFSFEPIANFHVSGVKDSVKNLSKVQATTNRVEIKVTGDVAQRQLPQIDKRAVDVCSDASRKSFIDASYVEAKVLASNPSSYISIRGASDGVYRAYFGATPTYSVISNLNAVANEDSASRTLSCVDSFNACSSGVIAYTFLPTTNIYFCNIFFNEVPIGSLCSGTTVGSRNVRSGTTLHELTHALVGTGDFQYGCSEDQNLPDPAKAINADNYNCFATQVYQDTLCPK